MGDEGRKKSFLKKEEAVYVNVIDTIKSGFISHVCFCTLFLHEVVTWTVLESQSQHGLTMFWVTATATCRRRLLVSGLRG